MGGFKLEIFRFLLYILTPIIAAYVIGTPGRAAKIGEKLNTNVEYPPEDPNLRSKANSVY